MRQCHCEMPYKPGDAPRQAGRLRYGQKVPEAGWKPALRPGSQESEALRAACLAGALVFVVAFWFDGGLFELPTAALFWVLLELGAARGGKVDGGSRKRGQVVDG